MELINSMMWEKLQALGSRIDESIFDPAGDIGEVAVGQMVSEPEGQDWHLLAGVIGAVVEGVIAVIRG
jgi:hypothetical protein